MRSLFLAILISIVGGLSLIPNDNPAMASGSVTFLIVPVATSTPNGLTQNTYVAVVQTATATSTPGTVEIFKDLVTGNTVNNNSIDTIIYAPGVNLTAGSVKGWRYNTGVSVPCTLIGLGNNVLSGDGTLPVIAIDGFTSGFTLYVSNMGVTSNGAAQAVSVSAVLNAASQLVMDRNKLASKTGNAFDLRSLVTTAHAIKMTNNILTAPGGNGYLDSTAVSSNDIIDWDHDTFSGCVTGYSGKSGEAVTNCLFLGNTVDLNLTSPAAIGDFVNCQFGQQASGGTNCLYGATNAKVYCDSNNLFIGPQNPGLNSGVSTSLIGSLSYNGLIWQNKLNTIGANAYSAAWCGGLEAGK